MRRQCVEHVCDQILHDRPVAAREAGEVPLDLCLVLLPLEGEHEQAQPGDPAFGALVEAPDHLGPEADRAGLPEEGLGLLDRKA